MGTPDLIPNPSRRAKLSTGRSSEACPVENLKKKLIFLFRWFDAEVTPDLIPNSEVKLGRSDGTRKGRVASRRNKEINFQIFLWD